MVYKEKKMKILCLMMFFLFAQSTYARDYQLGVVLGSPTGLSGKVALENNRSIDGALAYSLADDLGLELHADYLIEHARSFSINGSGPFELYYGIGARMVSIKKGKNDGDLAIGPRAPVGINYLLNNPNLELFAELALAFDVIPETNLDLEGGIGVRYRF